MIKIDTNYQSLSEVDPEIVRFYAEETREEITWIDDQPVVEEYTVIVLLKPYLVGYGDVSIRRAERKTWEIVKAELERAIAWEDFDVNHEQYLQWKIELEAWEKEQPHEDVWDEELQEFVPTLVDAPKRPQIDESKRIAHYEPIYGEFDANLWDFHGEHDEVIDHDARTITRTPILTAKPDEVIALYHRELAKALRDHIKDSPILVHGHYFQVDKSGRDNIHETMHFARRQGIEHETTDWITDANDVVTLTYHQVEAIQDAYVLRMAELFRQYNAWCATDMLTPFEYVEATV